MNKSIIAGFFLSLLFGPLGVFYGNVAAGIVMTAITLFCLYASPAAWVVMLPINIIVGIVAVSDHNAKVDKFIDRIKAG